mmetsp:Transcript_50187/g.160783  ORF Transcript_50187/g.160783 Transcript_50187/m.160783 type:complete len:202 (-) Transcript_50187:372-977(-)
MCRPALGSPFLCDFLLTPAAPHTPHLNTHCAMRITSRPSRVYSPCRAALLMALASSCLACRTSSIPPPHSASRIDRSSASCDVMWPASSAARTAAPLTSSARSFKMYSARGRVSTIPAPISRDPGKPSSDAPEVAAQITARSAMYPAPFPALSHPPPARPVSKDRPRAGANPAIGASGKSTELCGVLGTRVTRGAAPDCFS